MRGAMVCCVAGSSTFGQSERSACARTSVECVSQNKVSFGQVLRTVEVGADVEAVGLARSDGLGETEERSPEGPDALGVEDLGRVHRGARAGDLDAEAIPGER